MQAPLRPFLIVDGVGQESVSRLYRYGGGVQIFPAIFDHAGAFGFARFKVKLETERISFAKSLIPANSGRREPTCAFGEIKGVSMPVEDLRLLRQFRQPFAGFVAPSHRHPTDFLYLVRVDPGAKRFGQKLRAETNSDDSPTVSQLFPKPRFLLREPRVTGGVPYTHRTAHENNRIPRAR